MGHLNGILARVEGNLNKNFQKSQIPGGLPGGGMLKLRFDRYIRIISFLKQPLAFSTIPQSFVTFYFTMLGYIFGIDCQTTLQVQEKLISRLPVEIYGQLRCYCCVRILGQLSGYWAT